MPFALALLLAAAVMAGGCASTAKPAYVEQPVEDLYNKAMDLMVAGQFREAAQAFDEVDRQHPYSNWATRAQMMAAYGYYRQRDYDQAILAADRFQQLHPGNKDAGYAYYLTAVSYYDQIVDVGRDQTLTGEALNALQQVVARYPGTEYARDASLKIDLTLEHLAGKEMSVGRFYLRRREYVAAINRFRAVIDQYQTTSQTPEALHRLTEAYLALGVVDEARAAAAVLGYNFPASDWYRDSFRLLVNAGVAPIDISVTRPAQGKTLLQQMLSVFHIG